ncbi:hypothetical protein QQF64_006579 [Cirrhinus molitorella]|uniref:Uncharacterized protein n=1 Tax=Cirrhinus molitorella TaxID=172907 RepID=A0ABR3MBK6_9TELE
MSPAFMLMVEFIKDWNSCPFYSSYAWTSNRHTCGHFCMLTTSFSLTEHLIFNDKVQQWKDQLNENGLRPNLRKTEYVECGPQTRGTIITDNQNLKVGCFKYVGFITWQMMTAS